MSEHSRDATTGVAPGATDRPASGVEDAPWSRAGVAAFGGALLAFGLRRRSLGGAAMALLGGWMVYRSLAGGEGAPGGERDPATVRRSVTIGRSVGDLSTLLSDPERLGRIVGHVADVTEVGEDRQRWTVRGPLDREPSWETRLVREGGDDRLRWEVTDGVPVSADWSASFSPAPGDRGTEVVVDLRLDAPGGALGTVATKPLALVLDPVLGAALDRFKGLAETGEIATTEGNPSARGRGELL